MAAESAIRYIELLNDLAATMAASLIRDGIAPEKARASAERVAERVQEESGGTTVYFPKGLGYKLARRNAEILRRLEAGEDPAALAREFNVTPARIGQIRLERTRSRAQRDASVTRPRRT